MKHLDIRISGNVQGVFFRHSARRRAEELGITGFARNEPHGAVWIEAEGEPEELELFLAWCKSGPPSARVDNVEVEEGAPENYTGFDIV